MSVTRVRRTTTRRDLLQQVGLGGLVVVSASACGGLTRDDGSGDDGGGDEGTSPVPGADDSSPANVSISVLDRPSTTDEGRLAAYDAVVDAFLEDNPHVSMDVRELLRGGAMLETLPAKLANGTMETMFSMDPEAAYPYAAREELALIDEIAGNWESFDQLRPDVLDRVRDGSGGLFGLPSESITRGIYYNRRRFDEVGLDPDNPPTTWDEFREAALRLTDADNNMFGFGEVGGPSAAISFLSWFYSAGGRVEVDDNGKWRAGLADGEAAMVLEFVKDMRWADGSISPVLYEGMGSDLMGEMATDRVAMAFHAPTGTADVRAFGGDVNDYGFGPTPQNGGNAVLELIVAFCFAPNATPEQIRAALDFGTYQKFDVDALEIELKSKQETDTFIPLQGNSVGVLVPDSPLRQELDSLQHSYASASEETSLAYYEANKSFQGYGFSLFDPARVNELLGSVMEAVMTDPDSDIEALVDDANTRIQEILDEQ